MMTLLIHRIQEIVMKKLFKEALEDSPIIAAVKDDEGLSRCLTSDSRIIFILYGDIVTISDIVETVKSAGKLAIVHLDLINGLSSKEVSSKIHECRRHYHNEADTYQTRQGAGALYNPPAVSD